MEFLLIIIILVFVLIYTKRVDSKKFFYDIEPYFKMLMEDDYEFDNLGTAIDKIVSVTDPFYNAINRIILYQLSDGMSCPQIAKYLNEHGYKSKQGKEWDRHLIHLRLDYIRRKVKESGLGEEIKDLLKD